MADVHHHDVVLVVDDSPDTLKMLTDALDDAGMTVLVATEGEQALSLVQRIMPDIVLMDAVMPGMSGFDTCRRLKANKALSHVPIIFMTGLTETEHIVQGLEAGGVDYVTKPIVPDELMARIRVHLRNARAAHGAHNALDTLGRYLLAANVNGEILWSTPQAARLLTGVFKDFDTGHFRLPPNVSNWLRQSDSQSAPANATHVVQRGAALGKPMIELSIVGQISPGEFLLRCAEGGAGDERTELCDKFTLTHREAEVLFWIARGKSNRDIADILTLSPRTVNKHLEQIYAKLGVENRTSAAALAMRAIGER